MDQIIDILKKLKCEPNKWNIDHNNFYAICDCCNNNIPIPNIHLDHIKTTFKELYKTNIELECPICLELIRRNLNELELTDCGHIFHKDCLNNTRTNGVLNCPICRTNLDN